jgi:Fe2+ or Zn2+ uptake regulation protein
VNPSEEIRSTSAQDAAIESAVLQQVLALHPAVLSLAELTRELGETTDPASRDAVERAVRDLTGSGLLQRSEALVLPTRAALRFDELLGG